jgi:preprotein translocase subunit SecG
MALQDPTPPMHLVLLVVHMLIAVALVGVVLLQKSEGGALGIGGGGGGGFMTGRGTANFLTRSTAMLAAAFFASSLGLTLIAQHGQPAGSILDSIKAPVSATQPVKPAGDSGSPSASETKAIDPKPADAAPAGRGGILDKIQPVSPAPLPR